MVSDVPESREPVDHPTPNLSARQDRIAAFIVDLPSPGLAPSSRQSWNGSQEFIRSQSLDDLEVVHSTAHVPLPENHIAISTPLPVSVDESLHNSETAVRPYVATIRSLHGPFPHLRNVLSEGRHKHVKLDCYDYTGSKLSSRQTFSATEFGEIRSEANVSLGHALRNPPAEPVQLRLLVAEDLSNTLMECLGSTLGINPEMFEEHLLNSGWRDGCYDDPESDTWITRDIVKDYTSIKWYRPVKRSLQRPNSATDRKNLLNQSTQSLKWTEAVPVRPGKSFGVRHELKPSINILRRDWDLRTDTDIASFVNSSAAWEERATIWTRQFEACRIGTYFSGDLTEKTDFCILVLLLLDPLPILQDHMSGSPLALEKLGFYHPVSNDDVLGASWESDQAGVAASIAIPAPANAPPRALVRRRTHVALNAATVQNPVMRFVRKMVLSKIGRSQKHIVNETPGANAEAENTQDPEIGQNHESNAVRRTRPKARHRVRNFLALLTGDTPEIVERPGDPEEPDVIEERAGAEKIILGAVDRCIFERLVPRGPMMKYESTILLENRTRLCDQINRTKSTAESLSEYLSLDDDHDRRDISIRDPLDCLFAIIQSDISNILHLMDLALTEIGQHILDDTLIQERLVHWRHLLDRFDAELSRLEISVRSLAQFLTSFTYAPQDPSSVETRLRESISQISGLRQRTKRSNKALMANMSIVESKKGIAEAESVSKLTELAFLFIPLTFSASVFSMQVKELSTTKTPLSAFFILAITITTCSYALRLFIRSKSVVRRRKKLFAQIRKDSGVQPGDPISTRDFVAWFWRRIGLITVLITLLIAVLVTPLIVLWTRNLNRGYKALLTVLLLIIILITSWVITATIFYVDGRGLHIRRDIFKHHKKGWTKSPIIGLRLQTSKLIDWMTTRWFLIFLSITMVVAGLTVAIWTRPLVSGIKIGFTVFIGLAYLVSLIWVTFNALF
jgi:hypothetical protein